MLKSIGPKMEPCGTPSIISNHLLKLLFILTLCFLFDKYEKIKRRYIG